MRRPCFHNLRLAAAAAATASCRIEKGCHTATSRHEQYDIINIFDETIISLETLISLDFMHLCQMFSIVLLRASHLTAEVFNNYSIRIIRISSSDTELYPFSYSEVICEFQDPDNEQVRIDIRIKNKSKVSVNASVKGLFKIVTSQKKSVIIFCLLAASH